MRYATVALLCLCAAAASACVTGHYRRTCWFEPIADSAIESLRPDRADLSLCLERLGAPSFVWKLPDDGIALAYGWLDQRAWGISASYSYEYVSVQFSYDSMSKELQGVVLILGADLRLRAIHRGCLGQIADTLFRPPRPASLRAKQRGPVRY